MLIYAAIDRARAGGYPIPQERIAAWADNRLVWRLDQSGNRNHKLAEALLLASLFVFSDLNLTPYLSDATRQNCSWQSHLRIARNIIKRQGIVDRLDGDDPEYHFLIRWFSRLDVFGSFSDLSLGPPLPLDAYWPWDISKELQIDCLLGTSRTCISILAKIAVAIYRRRPLGNGHDSEAFEAESLDLLLSNVLKHPEVSRPLCSDLPSTSACDLGLLFISGSLHVTGEAYLTQLIRREHCEIKVEGAVHYHSTVNAEKSLYACLFLPMFLSGALTQDELRLELITRRLEGLAESGMERVSGPCLDHKNRCD